MTCYELGERSWLIYSVREHTGRKDQPKGFGRRDFRDLLLRARIQLGGPIVLVWDNVRLHLTKSLREFIETNADWLMVFQLPVHAPGLNPQEGIRSPVKRDIGNLAAAALSHITRAVKQAQAQDVAVPTGGHRRLPRWYPPRAGHASTRPSPCGRAGRAPKCATSWP
ncbi:transposase [Streptomyces sp. NPDC014983]|uniref:transposase n=1 Tax=Streptomyces sp. NPDC014983 TaxID=3364933 RepID=UPI0036FE951B